MSETTEKTRRRPAKGPRFGVAQVAPALGDIERNLELHAAAVEKARKDKVDVLVFPELSVTGYRLKDMVPEVAAQREAEVFSRLAEMSKDISIVVGLVEETDQHFFYNGAAYFEDGKLLHCKRKVYLPTYGMFDEQRYFARGNRVTAFDTAHGRVAILICEEMLHPTAATVAALDGATTLIVPSASPSSIAARSFSSRSGGFILAFVSYSPTASSLRAKWCGVTSQVARMPCSLARRTKSTARAVEMCAMCT